MTPRELEQTKAMCRRMIESGQGVLDMLKERESRNFAHDNALRPYQEAWVQWHRDLLAAIERDGDAFEVPPLAEIMRRKYEPTFGE